MAWSTPPTQATGDLITAAIYNTYLINNLLTLPKLDYAQNTGNTSVTGTTEGTAVAVVTGNSVTYQNILVLVEFWAPGVADAAATSAKLVLLRDSTVLGQAFISETLNTNTSAVYVAFYDTPSAGAHTYAAKAFASSTVTILGGAGGSGVNLPAFLRVSGAGT